MTDFTSTNDAWLYANTHLKTDIFPTTHVSRTDNTQATDIASKIVSTPAADTNLLKLFVCLKMSKRFQFVNDVETFSAAQMTEISRMCHNLNLKRAGTTWKWNHLLKISNWTKCPYR